MEVIPGGRLPVHSWAPDLDDGARRQALHCTQLPVAFHHVAVMADGHLGYGVPIGAVLALDGAISPYAVGNDIGCGMAMVPTTVTAGELLAPGRSGATVRDDVMTAVQAAIPSGQSSHRDPVRRADVDAVLDVAFDAMEEAAARSGEPLSTAQSPNAGTGKPLTRKDFVQRGRTQLGTLGSGNHFVELLAGPDDDVWLMLHSGSRGVGGGICNNFHRMALAHCRSAGEALPDPGLAWLPIDGGGEGAAGGAGGDGGGGGGGGDRWAAVGRCYERALRAGLDYAEGNRRHMLEAVAAVVERRFPGAVRWDGIVNIHHNDATAERHFGRTVWVHRKGAVKASAGTATITPGSMGTATFLGRGLGNPASFESCSHGAGRTRSRGRARKELSLRGELATIAAAGGKVFATSTEAVLDEMPGAYKDLDEVMANQADLVAAVRRFTPMGTYKGADPPKRRKDKARTWRPEEER